MLQVVQKVQVVKLSLEILGVFIVWEELFSYKFLLSQISASLEIANKSSGLRFFQSRRETADILGVSPGHIYVQIRLLRLCRNG